jgi:hypothetical protein
VETDDGGVCASAAMEYAFFVFSII